MLTAAEHLELMTRYGARNYAPLPVVIAEASGAWVTDLDGKRYLDMLSAYSALSHGHSHPELVEVLVRQAGRLALTSRAFMNDRIAPLCQELAALSGMDLVLLMNTGVEAIETALKAARRWGYRQKRVAPEKAEIIACTNNFHGRTVTAVSFSTEEAYRTDFGPFTPGFRVIPYGDAGALARAITPDTVAFLVEPVQGEGGIVIPPAGYLAAARKLCDEHRVLLMLDEIQTGLCRTGKMFAYQHEDMRPDVLVLGKALGGGLLPVSAVVASREVLGVFEPGSHGSTFGGNPLACAVAQKALELLVRDRYAERATELGAHALARISRLAESRRDRIVEARGRGLLLGIELRPDAGGARAYCERLMGQGVLCKETHEHTIRIAPPLVITEADLDWGLDRIEGVLSD